MRTKKFLFYLLAALLAGCVPVMSLHPLYTKEDTLFKEELLGTWLDDSNDTWTFERIPEFPESYALTFTDDEGKKGLFTATLLSLEKNLFLDVHPQVLPCDLRDPNKIEWVYNSFFFIPVHTFIKVEPVESKFRIKLTRDDKLKNLLTEDPNAVKHKAVKDHSIVLTAPTKELQKFVIKYAEDKRLFVDEKILSRKTTAEPNSLAVNDPNDNKVKNNRK